MIEQTVLIQKRSEAWDFMSLPSSQRQNVKMCFCMSDGNRRKGHNITISGSGGLNLGFIDPWQGAYRMQADKGPQISDEKENMATIQQEIRHLEASFRAAQDHLTTCQAKVQDHKRQKKTLKIQMDLAQEDMYRLEGEVNDAIPDAATIEQLEKELADAQGNLRNDEDQFGDLLTQLDEANGNSHNYKRLVEELEKRREEYELRVEKLKVKVTSFTQRREQALRSKNKALDEVQAAEVDKVELEKKRTEHQKFVDSDTEAARQLFPQRVKVPENETFESLNRKLERLKEERQRSETELGGSEEELLRAANAAKFTFEEAAREMNSTETVRRVSVLHL
jgi:chromosome segregation ATPase